MNIGPYEVRGELGRGGMGAVYRAWDAALEREVAIKVVALTDPGLTDRLRREGRAAARLRHPNIVAVHGLGEAQGRPYLVFDLVQGEALDARLRRAGPLPLREAARLVATIARAVEYAHGQGVVHRDLKPGNVVVDARGEPHVLDFGLARVLDVALRATATGELLGSPGFMAPEQASGEKHLVGAATDVYALGATLFALLAGRSPFHGHAGVAALRAILEDPPPPLSALRAEVPPALDELVARALAKAPAQRWASAGALADALESWLAPSAAQAPRRRASAASLALSGLASALVAGAVTWGAAAREAEQVGARLEVGEARLEDARRQTAGERAGRLEAERALERARADVAAASSAAQVLADGAALERQGAVHLATGRPRLAVEALARAVEVGGEQPDRLVLLAAAHRRGGQREVGAGHHDLAVQAAERALELAPEHLDAMLLRLRLGEDLGPIDGELATRAVRRGGEVGAPDDALIMLGLSFLQRGDAPAADQVAEGVLQGDPSHARALMLRGAARLTSGLAGAREDLWRAVELDPSDAGAWAMLAGAALQTESHHEAFAALTMIRCLRGLSPEESVGLAEALDALGQVEAAAELRVSAAAGFKGQARVLLLLSAGHGFMAAPVSRPREALECFRQALTVTGGSGPLAAEAYACQAWAHVVAGERAVADGAASAAGNAGGLESPWEPFARGAILGVDPATRGEAEAALTRALELDPELVVPRVLRLRLRAARGELAGAHDDALWLVRALGTQRPWGAEALGWLR